jgi:hypothetical protein
MSAAAVPLQGWAAPVLRILEVGVVPREALELLGGGSL